MKKFLITLATLACLLQAAPVSAQDALGTIFSRKSVRTYTEQPVSEEQGAICFAVQG